MSEERDLRDWLAERFEWHPSSEEMQELAHPVRDIAILTSGFCLGVASAIIASVVL